MAAPRSRTQRRTTPPEYSPRVVTPVRSQPKELSRSKEVPRRVIQSPESARAAMRAQALRDLSSARPQTRVRGLLVLGDLHDTSSAGRVSSFLTDENGGVRRAAAIALGTMGDRSAGRALVRALRDREPAVRAAAAEAIGNLREPQAVRYLVLRLRDPNAVVRRAAIHSLGQIGDVRATPALSARLVGGTVSGQVITMDPDHYNRIEIARALRQIADPNSLPALDRARRYDQNALVRRYALDAHREITAAQQTAGAGE
ncbi:HEAT repeat domain-containing protein [Candidatus Micrarchaeota archaeon]|nr:HEAT repeat domain-containing protein [Candidatus Micrarchaeota archaeon]MBU1681828.1 HEAT repeat domain-containing protein [Candidatus Micrarchaeota archaeon]